MLTIQSANNTAAATKLTTRPMDSLRLPPACVVSSSSRITRTCPGRCRHPRHLARAAGALSVAHHVVLRYDASTMPEARDRQGADQGPFRRPSPDSQRTRLGSAGMQRWSARGGATSGAVVGANRRFRMPYLGARATLA